MEGTEMASLAFRMAHLAVDRVPLIPIFLSLNATHAIPLQLLAQIFVA
jgi:hypothetical protein